MRFKSGLLILFLVFLLESPLRTYAWGAQGHQIIVEMAFSLLSPAAKQRVLAYLKGYPIDDAATWMDSVRGKGVPQYTYMKDWHFLDMDSNQTYAQVASNHDVVFNLQRVINAFKNMNGISDDSIRMNLKILFHLMGDITQPLHDGYKSDVGGNEVLIKISKFSKAKNLHQVWDDYIIEEGKISVQSSTAYYKKLTQAQIKEITNGTTTAWMTQARSYLTTNVYKFSEVKHGATALTVQYLDDNVPVVQQQLVYAAIRLANVLNTAFGN